MRGGTSLKLQGFALFGIGLAAKALEFVDSIWLIGSVALLYMVAGDIINALRAER